MQLPGYEVRNREAIRQLVRDFTTQKDGALITSATEGHLSQEITLTNNSGIFPFSLTQLGSGVTVNPFDTLLTNQDAFLILDMGVYLKNCQTADGVAIGGYQTYPNPEIFTPSGANLDHLRAIYESNLSYMGNQREWHRLFPARAFLKVPDVQKGQVTAAIQTAAGPPIVNQTYLVGDTSFGYDESIRPVEPRILLFGDSDNSFKLTMPAISGLDIADTRPGYENRLQLWAHGIYLAGAARNREKIFARMEELRATGTGL